MTALRVSQLQILGISIHMPHTWHDVACAVSIWAAISISIHMPHTWHDTDGITSAALMLSFQSTCHIRGMTVDSVNIAVWV